MLVAQAAFAAFGDLRAIAVLCEIGEKRFGLPFERAIDERADGNGNDEIGTAAAGLVRLTTGLARFRCELPLETKFDQRRKLRRGLKVDAAAAAAVTAGWAAFGDVLLATPRNDAIAAVPGSDGDRRFVDKLQ
jgi:hypothetical protein